MPQGSNGTALGTCDSPIVSFQGLKFFFRCTCSTYVYKIVYDAGHKVFYEF